MKKIVFLVFFFSVFQFKAQKDSLKKFAFSLDAGLILNKSFSHYDRGENYTSMSGSQRNISSSDNSGLLKPGASLSAGFHFGKPKKLAFIFALSLSLSSGAYHIFQVSGPSKTKNGDYYQTTDYLDVKTNQLLLNYEFGIKTKLSRKMYMQNSLSLQQNLYKVNHNSGYSSSRTWIVSSPVQIVETPIDNTEIQRFSIYKGFVTGSYKLGLFYKFNLPNSSFDLFISRSFSLGKYVLPLWTFGMRFYLK